MTDFSLAGPSAEFGLVVPTPSSRPTGTGTGRSTAHASSGAGSQKLTGTGTGRSRAKNSSGAGSNGLTIWNAGQPLPAGLTFSGPLGRLALDANRIYQSFGANVPRYVVGNTFMPTSSGTLRPAWILEAGSSNVALGSCTFDNSTTRWQLNTWFTIQQVPSCIAGQVAYQHTGDGVHTSANRFQNVGTYASGQIDCYYAILEKGTASSSNLQSFDQTANADNAGITLNWNTMVATIDSANSGQRNQSGGLIRLGIGPNGGELVILWIACSGIAGNIRRIAVAPNEGTLNTNWTIIHHAQLEPGVSFPSSPIITTSATVSRAAESAILPFTAPPGTMTIYTKCIQRGVVQTANARVWQIGNNVDNTNSLRIIGTGRAFSLIDDDGGSGGTSVGSLTPLDTVKFGDEVELVAQLYADGSVQILSSLNGVAEVPGSRSGAKALPAAWGDTKIYLGKGNGSFGLESLKYSIGSINTLAQMQGYQ